MNALLYFQNLQGTERTVDYETAVRELLDLGYSIQAAVIDGRRGVREMLEGYGIPVQNCQFHQRMAVTRCLTRRPKLPANKELRDIARLLSTSGRIGFTALLKGWHNKWGVWLKESYIDPLTGRRRYIHDRTRRAYFSLLHNLPYLFTYQDKELVGRGITIPKTTNALEGRFTACKRILTANPRLAKPLRTKIFFSLLSGATEVKNN